ncbi:MAG: hypothetical protein GX801_02050 [Fibrobacter sp.]|nr:hypothetical protein [Fibrobacter sp.]
MRKVFGLIFTLLVAAPSMAQYNGIGFGGYLQAGNPHEAGGLNMKFFLSQRHAIDAQLSIQMSPLAKSMGAYGTYLFHWWDALPINKGAIPLYIGPNLGFGVWDGGFTIRGGAIAGLAYALPKGTAPLDFYLQLNPAIEVDFVDKTHASFNLYLQFGIRFYI